MTLLPAFCSTIDSSCKKSYNPPVLKTDNKFLVIDGVLVSSLDSPSVFNLSRTIKLTDTTFSSFPEAAAIVSVEGKNGEIFNFIEEPGGIYKAEHTIFNNAEQYRLKIQTANGNQYESDFVDVKTTPPIDSISWQYQNDVEIYANTHDPLNNTKYYRWDFIETWQHRAKLSRSIAQTNGLIYYIDSTNQTFDCWSNMNSTQILTGSSVALSEDVISKDLINTIPQNSDKIGIRYSILVKQYALAEDAYQYFQILKKNTESLGSIFDAQPTQLIGNIHSVKNPSEIVIGFFTASTVQQKRIFINRDDVIPWNPIDTGRSCDIKNIPQDSNNYLLYNYPDNAYEPYYYGTMPDLIFLAKRYCLDCRANGGTTTKPSYW